MPLFITILDSCKILLIYTLNSTAERPHPCLTPLFILIGSDISIDIKFDTNFCMPINTFYCL
jgi:hypothetical protein